MRTHEEILKILLPILENPTSRAINEGIERLREDDGDTSSACCKVLEEWRTSLSVETKRHSGMVTFGTAEPKPKDEN